MQHFHLHALFQLDKMQSEKVLSPKCVIVYNERHDSVLQFHHECISIKRLLDLLLVLPEVELSFPKLEVFHVLWLVTIRAAIPLHGAHLGLEPLPLAVLLALCSAAGARALLFLHFLLGLLVLNASRLQLLLDCLLHLAQQHRRAAQELLSEIFNRVPKDFHGLVNFLRVFRNAKTHALVVRVHSLLRLLHHLFRVLLERRTKVSKFFPPVCHSHALHYFGARLLDVRSDFLGHLEEGKHAAASSCTACALTFTFTFTTTTFSIFLRRR
mmetsp:Transcript_977/g.1765  ORF Transcript_977/g.1765 Transcript_977/m.1765 type:complete len:269 (+) Transcript_977:544-1350(+)